MSSGGSFFRPGFLRLLQVIPAVLLSACYTVTDQPEPEKWAPKERAEAHVRVGMEYLRRNQLDTANYEFDAAIEIYPDSDTAYHAKALTLTRQGNNDQASEHFAKAVSLNANNFVAANDYGIHLCQNGNSRRGITILESVNDNAANNQVFATQLGLGICYFRDGRLETSAGYLRRVLEQSPQLPQALLPMAEISIKQENFLSARAFLERYFGTGAISERSLYLAIITERELGDINKANQYRRELRKRYPSSEYLPELQDLLG